MIRRMELKDIDQVVRIHLESFPGFFLSFLGPGFLKVYYRAACLDREGICLVSSNEERDVRGFVVGSSSPAGFYRRIFIRHLLGFLLNVIRAVANRPSIIGRLIRTAARAAGKQPQRCAGLFSIAVCPAAQGQGVGRDLVRVFIRQADDRGCLRVSLTTDSQGNDRVNDFYRSLGFAATGELITPEGRRMFQYTLEISHVAE